MEKKLLISLGLIGMMSLTISQVCAHSTIYTDDLGRMHFLGKDPGAKTLQKVEDFDNPELQDMMNPTGGLRNVDYFETNIKRVNIKGQNTGESNRSKGAFTSEKGAMDASNPYVYGGTNVKSKEAAKDVQEAVNKETNKKRFWHWW